MGGATVFFLLFRCPALFCVKTIKLCSVELKWFMPVSRL